MTEYTFFLWWTGLSPHGDSSPPNQEMLTVIFKKNCIKNKIKYNYDTNVDTYQAQFAGHHKIHCNFDKKTSPYINVDYMDSHLQIPMNFNK